MEILRSTLKLKQLGAMYIKPVIEPRQITGQGKIRNNEEKIEVP